MIKLTSVEIVMVGLGWFFASIFFGLWQRDSFATIFMWFAGHTVMMALIEGKKR